MIYIKTEEGSSMHKSRGHKRIPGFMAIPSLFSKRVRSWNQVFMGKLLSPGAGCAASHLLTLLTFFLHHRK